MSIMEQDSYLAALEEILADFKHLDLTGRVEFDHPKVPVAQGGFGEVYKGRYKREDGSELTVAIKCLTVYSDGRRDAIKIFRREIKAWSMLQHQNVLPLLGYIWERGPLSVPSLVSEWVDNGVLVDFMKTQKAPSFERESDMAKLVLNMAEGLEYLHENDVVHSDFKSTNVLVSGDGEAVIADFGSAHICSGDDSGLVSSNVSGLRGTSRWLAYELLVPNERDPKPTKASDVWAFGMTLYELIKNRCPYADHLIDAQVLISIMNRKLPTCPSTLSPREKEIWAICVSCWKCDPVERPSMTSICRTIKPFAYPEFLYGFGGPVFAQAYPLHPLSIKRRSSLSIERSTDDAIHWYSPQGIHREIGRFLLAPWSGFWLLPSHLPEELLQRHLANEDIHVPCGPAWSDESCDYYVGNHRGAQVLVRELKDVRKLEDAGLSKEIETILAIPPHPNVQTLLGCTSYPIDDVSLALVYDHVGGEDILSFLKNRPDSNVLALAMVIAEGLAHIHNYDGVHCNMRASNVFVLNDGQPVISGFNCARKLPCDVNQREVQGSLRCMAPEVMNAENKNSQIITKERDVWAFGMIVYELLPGDIPCAEEKYDALLVIDIAQGRLPMCPSTSESWSLVRQGLWSICLACWNIQPEARPSMRKVAGALKGLSILQSVLV